MAERREYSDTAVPTVISPGIGSGDTTIVIADPTGWPAGGANGKVTATIARGLPAEERIQYTSRTGGTLSGVTRGFGGTAASAHAADTPIEHTLSANDVNLVNKHAAVTTDDDHTQYMKADGTRHDLTARHAFGAALGTPAAATTIVPDAVAGAGSAAAPAHADHTHGIVAAAATTITGVNAEGVSTSFPRADHDHALGTDVVTATQIAANAVGASEIATDAVGTAEIAAGAVNTAEIADFAVTHAKFSVNNPPTAARAFATGTTSLAGAAYTIVALAGESYDYGNNFAANAYTTPVTGLYDVRGHVFVDGANNPQIHSAAIFVNGVIRADGVRITDRGANAGDDYSSHVTDLIALVAGDTVTLRAWNGGGNAQLAQAGAAVTWMAIVKVV